MSFVEHFALFGFLAGNGNRPIGCNHVPIKDDHRLLYCNHFNNRLFLFYNHFMYFNVFDENRLRFCSYFNFLSFRFRICSYFNFLNFRFRICSYFNDLSVLVLLGLEFV